MLQQQLHLQETRVGVVRWLGCHGKVSLRLAFSFLKQEMKDNTGGEKEGLSCLGSLPNKDGESSVFFAIIMLMRSFVVVLFVFCATAVVAQTDLTDDLFPPGVDEEMSKLFEVLPSRNAETG